MVENFRQGGMVDSDWDWLKILVKTFLMLLYSEDEATADDGV